MKEKSGLFRVTLKWALRAILYFVIGCFCASLLIVIVDNIKEHFSNYPIDGEYYISIFVSDGYVRSSPYYQANLAYGDDIIIDRNVLFYPNLIGDGYTIRTNDKDSIKQETVILSLLEKGYAKIVDEGKASDLQIEKQNAAKKDSLGIWNVQDKSVIVTEQTYQNLVSIIRQCFKDTMSILTNIIGIIINICRKNKLISWILGSILTFSALLNLVHFCFFKYHRIKVIFAGDKSSGKTTLMNAIKNPDMSEKDLLKPNPTPMADYRRIIRDSNGNNKRILMAHALDYPGGDYHYILDYFKDNRSSMLSKNYVVLSVAPTASNDLNIIDYGYVANQYNTIDKLWRAVIKAKPKKKIYKLILFINKNDLFADDDQLKIIFKEHISVLRKACYDADVEFTCIVGSAVKRNGIAKMLEILMNR